MFFVKAQVEYCHCCNRNVNRTSCMYLGSNMSSTTELSLDEGRTALKKNHEEK